jgi:hypothetical protein
MTVTNRVLGVLLIVGAIVTGLYWLSYFSGGDVMATHERWYTAFESSFPVADGWMAFCMAAAGAGFVMQRGWAAPLGLMAGSALIYLTCMDVTFNVENGLYALMESDDDAPMKLELFINVSGAILGIWTLVASWPRRRQA